MKIESTVDSGTTVRLYLPRTEPIALNPSIEAPSAAAASADAKILIIDGDPDVRGFLSESLATLGLKPS